MAEQALSQKPGGIRVPVWLVSIIVAAILGWSGSWIGYSVHSGATTDSRISVLEARAEAAETDRKETLDRVKRIEDMVTWLTTQIQYANPPYIAPPRHPGPRTSDRLGAPAPARQSRNPGEVSCGEGEIKIQAANGEWFCRAGR